MLLGIEVHLEVARHIIVARGIALFDLAYKRHDSVHTAPIYWFPLVAASAETERKRQTHPLHLPRRGRHFYTCNYRYTWLPMDLLLAEKQRVSEHSSS